jgi:hypothetical protein
MAEQAMEAYPEKDGWDARIAAGKAADEKVLLMRLVETIVPQKVTGGRNRRMGDRERISLEA